MARDSAPAGWGAVKRKLEGLGVADLVRLLRDVYEVSPDNRRFLQGRLLPSSADLEKYRDRVIDAIYPDPLGRRRVSVAEAERLIRHYRLSSHDEPGVVDLMLSMVEAGTEQSADLGCGDESYFGSLERALEGVVKTLPLPPHRHGPESFSGCRRWPQEPTPPVGATEMPCARSPQAQRLQ